MKTVIAIEAKQSMSPQGKWIFFVASLLAKTDKTYADAGAP
jgi:hypothetical protein